MVAGNERVFAGALADARFFWDQDRRVTLASRVEALSQRVFHAKLGSLRDRWREWRGSPTSWYNTCLAPMSFGHAARWQLAKADLSTGMVGEFPELQGTMGHYYALHDGEHRAVANAIAEHYRPLGPK